MFRAVFILHILQQYLSVLGSIRSLVLQMNIHTHVLLPQRLLPLERIKDMCLNGQHTRHSGNFGITSGQLLACKLYGKV